jgi:hypothetical protein
MNLLLQEKILDTVLEQIEFIQKEPNLSPKERIDLVCRLLPYVTPKKGSERGERALMEEDPLTSFF